MWEEIRKSNLFGIPGLVEILIGVVLGWLVLCIPVGLGGGDNYTFLILEDGDDRKTLLFTSRAGIRPEVAAAQAQRTYPSYSIVDVRPAAEYQSITPDNLLVFLRKDQKGAATTSEAR